MTMIGTKKIKNGKEYFSPGFDTMNYYFKDEEAFQKHPDEVCYIPEGEFDDAPTFEIDDNWFYEKHKIGTYTRKDLEKIVEEINAYFKEINKDPITVEVFFSSLIALYPETIQYELENYD